MRQCIIKVMVVFGQYFLQLLKRLSLGDRDAHGCLVHPGDRAVISFGFFSVFVVVDLVAHRTIQEVLQTP